MIDDSVNQPKEASQTRSKKQKSSQKVSQPKVSPAKLPVSGRKSAGAKAIPPVAGQSSLDFFIKREGKKTNQASANGAATMQKEVKSENKKPNIMADTKSPKNS